MLLGAYYYPWYGKAAYPIAGGGDWESGFTNQPVLGRYDNRDSGVIKKHLEWAREAGVDFLLMNWVNPESQKDITLRDHVLPYLSDSGVKFCIHYDSSVALNHLKPTAKPSYNFNERFAFEKTKGDKFLEDIKYLSDTYFNHPQYLKINGLPVMVIYNVSAFRNNVSYFDKLPPLFLIADVVYWSGLKFSGKSLSFLWQTAPKDSLKVIMRALKRIFPKSYEKDFKMSEYFKGITGYNLYNTNRSTNFLENVNKLYAKFRNYALSQNLHFFPSLLPGYDDRKLNGLERPILPRGDGKFYREFWEIARKNLDPEIKMALLTSFNEWHEGTEIEPSEEYGKKYLELTKQEKYE
ncbi:MAG: glycoside hydrolase family 99-like domain-containing protein [Candidatus Pacebacteria bacterium]|nr:glycoside hydrolase family 99-like domain-containing protein [Candidatus Paceibacterota bacterium]